MTTPRKTSTRAPKLELNQVVETAKERATIPTKPVVEHTKLFRASLQLELSAANNTLAGVDLALQIAASTRDEAVEAAENAYESAVKAAESAYRLALNTATEAKEGALSFARERFNAIRFEVDLERNDLVTKIEGLEAALKATAPAEKAEPKLTVVQDSPVAKAS
jgi:hypothetical protein